MLGALYALAGLSWLVGVHPLWLGACGLALAGLLAWREIGRLRQAPTLCLTLDYRRDGITLQQQDQPYFFSKYKVYPCRWFAILKLVEQSKTRTLILNPDSFDSPREYRNLRHAIYRMETRRAD